MADEIPRETVHFGAAEAAVRFPTFHAAQAAAAAAAEAEAAASASASEVDVEVEVEVEVDGEGKGGQGKAKACSGRGGGARVRAPEYTSECGFVMSEAWPAEGEYVPRGCWGCCLGAREATSAPEGGTRVFYRIHTNMRGPACLDPALAGRPHRKYLLLMGVAASCEAWEEQVAALCAPGMPDTSVLCVENRGIGFSDAPEDVNGYSLGTLGRDALACMDAVGWTEEGEEVEEVEEVVGETQGQEGRRGVAAAAPGDVLAGGVHVVGFSMGGMVALELALRIAPGRFLSCCAISSSRAGKRALPLCANVPVLLGPACAATPEDRARADLRCHFSRHTLQDPALVEALMASYIARSEHGRRVGKVRSRAGESGQVRAVVQSNRLIKEAYWTLPSEATGGRTLPLPIVLVHGTEDKIAPFANSLEMADILRCRLVALPAGHMVPFERPAMLSAEIHAHAESAEHILRALAHQRLDKCGVVPENASHGGGNGGITGVDDAQAILAPKTRILLRPSVGPVHPDGPDPALCSRLMPQQPGPRP